MSKVVLNEALRSMLGDVSNPFYIVDESGAPVLYVAPVQSLYEGEEIDLSEEELQRREQEGGRPLSEFLAEMAAKYSESRNDVKFTVV